MRLITGSMGEPHVTSNDDGEFNQGIFGAGLFVLSNGNKLRAEIIDANTVRIRDGSLLFQGRHALINPGETETVNIENGSIGQNRIDYILAHYEMDAETGYEDIRLVVKKGANSTGTPQPPSFIDGDIRTGSTVAEVPLYEIKHTGLEVTIEQMFEPFKPITEIAAAMYPVGMVVTFTNGVDPAKAFGGLWQDLGEVYLVGAGGAEVGSKIGSNSIALTLANMPSHSHSVSLNGTSGAQSANHTHGIPELSGGTSESGDHAHTVLGYNNGPSSTFSSGSTPFFPISGSWSRTSSANGNHTHSIATNPSNTGANSASHTHAVSLSGNTGENGSGVAFDNRPYSQVVHHWERIA